MPRGVYPRTLNQLKAAKANLAKGRELPARRKAAETLKELAQTDEWREKVSQATTQAMHRPEVRKRHLQGLRQAQKLNFKGGNGQKPTPLILQLAQKIEPLGYRRELVVPTKGHKTGLRPPSNYKVDFGHLRKKIAIELDKRGTHRWGNREQDLKKDQVLEALGWKVIRIVHQAGASCSQILWDLEKLFKLLDL